MLHHFDINTCIVTTVSAVRNTLSAACDAALAASLFLMGENDIQTGIIQSASFVINVQE